jgi:hypothetical protein
MNEAILSQLLARVNRAHNFKLIAIGISRHEDENANFMILKSIKDAMLELLDFTWSPKIVMPDRAGAISNATMVLTTSVF